MRLGISQKPFWLLLAAVLCAAGVWLYADRVLIPHQISDAVVHNRPTGNRSDLYPQWLGARELLLYGHDPYSAETTREIQQGYYGRPLDPSRPGEPKDQQAFAYPVYVAFYLAPTMHLPFEAVRKGFFWVLFILTVVSIPLWLRVLRWSAPLWAQGSMIIFTIGSLTVMQGLKLPQMTLLVAALLAIGLALLASDRPIAAGVALALATIKPQLVWLLLFWLTIWTLADWRRRYRWAASFLCAMAILCAASEWYLPNWIFRFVQAVHRYQNYNDAVSILDKLLPAGWGLIPSAFAVAATAYIGWKNRRVAVDTPSFAAMTSLTLAVTVIVTPSYALYNEVILLSALLMLVRDRQLLWNQNLSSRVLLSLAAVLLLWQWLASIVLAGLSFVLPLRTFEAAWPVPLWTVHFLAVAVAGLVLMVMMSHQRTFTTSVEPGSS
jgi:Glycosyltransferase family 87